MKNKLTVLVEMLIVGVLVFLLSITHALSALDYLAKDCIYQIPRGINSRIKIIGIDEKTLDEYGPIQTWSRSRYAELLDILPGEPLIIMSNYQYDDKGQPLFISSDRIVGSRYRITI